MAMSCSFLPAVRATASRLSAGDRPNNSARSAAASAPCRGAIARIIARGRSKADNPCLAIRDDHGRRELVESTPCDGGLPTCIVEPYMQLGRFPHQANQFADWCFAQSCEAVLMQAVMEPDHGLMRRAGIEIGAE